MRFGRTATRLAASVVTCGALVSCTGTDDAGPSTSQTTPQVSSSTAPGVTLTRPDAPFAVRIRQVSGAFPAARRDALRLAIGRPVSAWFARAFLAADYPTRRFPGAFDSWTHGAIPDAKRHRDVTTNAVLGPDLRAVVADTQRASVFVFANRGVAGGATANVRLAMNEQKQDGTLVDCVVWGRVYLTRDKGRWRIFGYDLRRSVEAS